MIPTLAGLNLAGSQTVWVLENYNLNTGWKKYKIKIKAAVVDPGTTEPRGFVVRLIDQALPSNWAHDASHDLNAIIDVTNPGTPPPPPGGGK